MTQKKATKKSPRSATETIDWYGNVRPLYEGLTAVVCSTLESLIRDKNIDCLSVSGRTKSLTSLGEKLKQKVYRDPASEIHDFTGIRVTVYLESDVQKVSELIRRCLHVHPDKSMDKTNELGTDRMGYRSIHFVCDLGKDRIALPEYAPYKGLLFEIQVRTVLQHAWAEIEHDRSYKFSGVLPEHLRRRLNVAAGTLEMVDREFDAISEAIDEYKEEVATKAEKGDLNIGLDTTSLSEYINKKFPLPELVSTGRINEDVVSELEDFGIHRLAELGSIFSKEFIEEFKAQSYKTTDLGLLRDALMYADIDRYFEVSWKEHWSTTGQGFVALLTPKYGEEKVIAVLEEHGIYYGGE